jgi:hypothetical protein
MTLLAFIGGLLAAIGSACILLGVLSMLSGQKNQDLVTIRDDVRAVFLVVIGMACWLLIILYNVLELTLRVPPAG